MSVLYVTQPDAVINKAHEAFKIALKQEDGTWQKRFSADSAVSVDKRLNQEAIDTCPNN